MSEALARITQGMSIQQTGEIFYQSGFFPDVKSEAQAIVKIMAGAACGLDAFTSMANINIIKGRIEMNAHLHSLHVKQSEKYDFEVLEHTDQKCVIQFWELSKRTGQWQKSGVSSFSQDDAKKAGLISAGGMYQKYPRNMLLSRAMTNGVEWFCPDVFQSRVYAPGEISGTISVDSNPDKYSDPIPVESTVVHDTPVYSQKAFSTAYEKIRLLFDELGYPVPHQQRSIQSHLGVDQLSDCQRMDKLKAYYEYLEQKLKIQTWEADLKERFPDRVADFQAAVKADDIEKARQIYDEAFATLEGGA